MGSLVCLVLFTNLNLEGHSNSTVPFLVSCFMQALVVPFLSRLVVHAGFQAIEDHHFHVNQIAWAAYCLRFLNFHHSCSFILECFRCYWSFVTSFASYLVQAQRHFPNWTCLQHAETNAECCCLHFAVLYLGICFCEGFWLAQSYWRTMSLRLVRSLQTSHQ